MTDRNGVRQSHPNPAEIGRPVSTDPSVPLSGEIYVGTQTGTLGESWRVKVPIFDGAGTVIGSASVGVLESTLAEDLYEDLPQLFGWLLGAALLGSLGAMYISKLVWRRIYKLEPEEIAALLETRDAMLHGLGEGLVAVDADGKVALVNDEARRLLGLGEEITGQPAGDCLEPGIRRMLTAGSAAGGTGALRGTDPAGQGQHGHGGRPGGGQGPHPPRPYRAAHDPPRPRRRPGRDAGAAGTGPRIRQQAARDLGTPGAGRAGQGRAVPGPEPQRRRFRQSRAGRGNHRSRRPGAADCQVHGLRRARRRNPGQPGLRVHPGRDRRRHHGPGEPDRQRGGRGGLRQHRRRPAGGNSRRRPHDHGRGRRPGHPRAEAGVRLRGRRHHQGGRGDQQPRLRAGPGPAGGAAPGRRGVGVGRPRWAAPALRWYSGQKRRNYKNNEPHSHPHH